MSNARQAARELFEAGLVVLPVNLRQKSPTVDWKQYQTERPTKGQVGKWFPSNRELNLWVATGHMSGHIVLDCDSAEGDAFWREYLGDTMDQTACVRTANGHHYWFTLAEDDDAKSWSFHPDEDHPEELRSFDVRGDKTGVIVPPSVHKTGLIYEWVRPLASALPWNGQAAKAAKEAVRATEAKGDTSPGTSDGVHSMLESLLAKKPAAGGRNVWLSKVCGHLAKMVPYSGAYLQLVAIINQSLAQPLDDSERDKTAISVWGAEQQKATQTGRGTTPSAANGYLIPGGSQLFAVVKVGDDEVLQAISDFDLTVKGRTVDDMHRITYLVDLHRERGGIIDCQVPSKTFASSKDMDAWLAGYGVSIRPQANDRFCQWPAHKRLLAYVEDQPAPTFHVVEHLGWDEASGGFLTHEGVLVPGEGMTPFRDRVPDPKLVDWAPYRYGMAPESEARAMLQRVLRFHDENVTAVFGAWWAACFLKAQLMKEASLFPFIAMEAPSESGKTTGFFSIMLQLNGNHEGHGEYTIPVLRDRASAHRSGIVWIDDMSNTEHVLDLLRQVTSEGSRSKKGQDRTTNERVHMVAPIAISAEGLGALSVEKALMDRAIRLSVPSPVGRRGEDGVRPQWDDILDLRKEYPDLTIFAGTLAKLALEAADTVKQVPALRMGSGRWADKVAVLRAGARILDAMLGGGTEYADRVDRWCTQQTEDAPDRNDNVLTMQILPSWVSDNAETMQTSSAGGPVAFYDEGQLWYHEEQLATWWAEYCRRIGQHGARTAQLGALSSLRSQRAALGLESAVREATKGRPRVQRRYVKTGEFLTQSIFERASSYRPLDSGGELAL